MKQISPFIRILAFIGLVALSIYIISPEAVSGPIHAIKISDGVYIHGWNLDCEGRERCTAQIDGSTLTLELWPMHAGLPAGPVECAAMFAGSEIRCGSAYITSSYWPRGVELKQPLPLSETVLRGIQWRNPLSFFYGWSEQAYLLFGLIIATATTFYTVTMLFKGLKGQTPSRAAWGKIIVVVGSVATLGFLINFVPLELIFDSCSSQNCRRSVWFVWIAVLMGLFFGDWLSTEKPVQTNQGMSILSGLILTTPLFIILQIWLFAQLLMLDFID